MDAQGPRLEVQVRQLATRSTPRDCGRPTRPHTSARRCRRNSPRTVCSRSRRRYSAPGHRGARSTGSTFAQPCARTNISPVQIAMSRGERARLRTVGAHDVPAAGGGEPVPSRRPSDSAAAGGGTNPAPCPRRSPERSSEADEKTASGAAPDPREDVSARRLPEVRGPAPRRSGTAWGSETASSPEAAGTQLETPASLRPQHEQIGDERHHDREHDHRPSPLSNTAVDRQQKRSRCRRTRSPPRKREARRRCCRRCRHGSTAPGTSGRSAANTPGVSTTPSQVPRPGRTRFRARTMGGARPRRLPPPARSQHRARRATPTTQARVRGAVDRSSHGTAQTSRRPAHRCKPTAGSRRALAPRRRGRMPP